MLSQDEQIALFVDAINKNALKMRREIEKDTKKLYLEETKKLEAAAEDTMKNRLAYAEKEMLTDLNRKNAADKAVYRREICMRRKELTDKVFDKAAVILTDFSRSEEYTAFIEKSINKIKIYLSDGFTLFVKNGDEEIISKAAVSTGAVCTVKTDDSIKIGGVKAESADGRKIIDDTLDERLSEQYGEFLSYAGSELNV